METGILYVIYNKWISDPETDEMPYKIGITKNTVEDRYYGLGLKMPGTFETLFAYKIENYVKAEQYLHGIFQKYCVNGEWFKLTQKELDLIKANCEAMDGILVTDEIESEIKINTEIIDNEDESEQFFQYETLKTPPLEDMIKTIGMKTFINYYDKLKNESLQAIIQYMKDHENYKINSINAKASTGKRIFKFGLEKQALEIISKSERIDNEIRDEAIKLLK